MKMVITRWQIFSCSGSLGTFPLTGFTWGYFAFDPPFLTYIAQSKFRQSKMNKNILNCGWEPQAVTTGGNVTPAMSIFTFVKFRMACGFLYRQDNFFLINYAHNFHTANLKRKHAEVKRRKWTGAFSEISATRPWTWKRKAFHKILTEAFEIKQGKWSQNPKDSMTPEDENRLLDESIHFFYFWGVFFTLIILLKNERKQ